MYIPYKKCALSQRFIAIHCMLYTTFVSSICDVVTFSFSAESGKNAYIWNVQYIVLLLGAYDDFSIDPKTGEVRLSGELDFDTRNLFLIEIAAFDGGEPSLTGQ